MIDDDPAALLINEIIIKKNIEGHSIVKFTSPSQGLNYLLEDYLNHPEPAFLLLDINMPGTDGWEILESLSPHIEKAHGMLLIYLLSSSINATDTSKAEKLPYVKGFITKPLSKERLLEAIKI